MIVRDIMDALDAKVASLLPTYKKSAFNFDMSMNNRKASKKIYAINVDSGVSASGVIGSVTIDQNFQVVLSDVFQPKQDSDKDLEAKILSIHDDIETIYKEVYQKRLNLSSAQVLLVEVVEISAPEVDLDNSTVNINATFKVRYRTQI